MRRESLIANLSKTEKKEFFQINLHCKSIGSLEFTFSVLAGWFRIIGSLLISYSPYAFILSKSSGSSYWFYAVVDKLSYHVESKLKSSPVLLEIIFFNKIIVVFIWTKKWIESRKVVEVVQLWFYEYDAFHVIKCDIVCEICIN